MNLVIKDAFRQILGRIASAIGGFLVIKIITPYLGPLRFGDYSTILKYFAIRSAFADFGLYVIALKQLGALKKETGQDSKSTPELETTYHKFFSTRMVMIVLVYTMALVLAYLIPAYTANPYLVWGLPIGMLFSASFMTAGVLQIPLQLFWKMEHVSIGLILARIVQLGILAITVFRLFEGVTFGEFSPSPFMFILVSVLASGVTQGIYVWWAGRKFLTLKRNRDREFSKKLLGSNWKYGLAYYFSSFHTLLILMMLSWMYPTVEGRTLVGVWALALALIEILLIVPSALGNSLIHKVADATTEEKRTSFGNLCFLVTWIGCLVTVLFRIFGAHIIHFIGGMEYLSTPTTLGSDWLLPRLGVILTLSFIKQVHNYLFVSTGHQNTLLSINFFGVVVGVLLAIPLLQNYQLYGGLVAQGILELLFVGGALFVARRKGILLHINVARFIFLFAFTASIFLLVPRNFFWTYSEGGFIWIARGGVLALIAAMLSLPWLKEHGRGL